MNDDDRDMRETQIYSYVEGLLNGEERRAFEARMAADAPLRAEVERARTLLGDLDDLHGDVEPVRDLWPDIEARLARDPSEGKDPVADLPVNRNAAAEVGTPRSPWQRRVSLGIPQVIAAGIAVVLFSGGGTWLALKAGDGAGPQRTATEQSSEPSQENPTVGVPGPTGGERVVPNFASSEAFREYDRAVEDLQIILDGGRDRLSPETIRILEESLASIDLAIRDARRTLSEDPESGALNQLLGRHLKTKLDLLRRTAAALQSNA